MALEFSSELPFETPALAPRANFMDRRIRRAAAACYYCHARKVRCDAAILGYPCTNCTLDKRTDCTLRPNATSRFRKLQIKKHVPAKAVEAAVRERSSPAETSPALRSSDKEEVLPSIESVWNPEWDILPLAEDLPVNPFPERPCWLPDFPVNFLDLDRLSTMPMGEVHNISTKGCLEVPPRHVTEVFLNKYFLLVHPLLPILDEGQVWGACIQGSEDGSLHPKLSLFVFQAVLLASSAFVPIEVIHQCGFSDHHSTRRALYSRAKVLYDTGFELDAIARAQGCVLLTFHTTAEDPEATMTWNLCAIQNAMAVRGKCGLSGEESEDLTKNRLYWSIFVRDRILWLGRHRSPHFISAHFKAPMNFLTENDLGGEILFSPVYTPEAKRLLVGIFHAQCQLAIIITDVISIAFSSYHRYPPRLSADALTRSLLGVKDLRARLNHWRDESQSVLFQTDMTRQESIEILTKLIWLHYQSARIALSHHETFLVESHMDILQDRAGGILLNIAKDLKGSVHQMTHVMKFFAVRNLTETIPISVYVLSHMPEPTLSGYSVPVLLPFMLISTRLAYCGTPMILAAIDSKLSPSQSESIERGSALNYCSAVVTQSRGTYDITEFFSQGTNHLLHLAYRITDNVFREGLGKTSRNSITASDAIHGRDENQSRLPLTPFKNLRIKGWIEAFLKYPRAYLSISACIDHSLATGRLPRDDSLPPLIRDTLPLVLGLPSLPWTISAPVKEDTKFHAADLIEDPSKTREDFIHPPGYSLDDPWYWTMLQTFNGQGDGGEFVGPDKANFLLDMVDLDSDDMAPGLARCASPPLVHSYNLPNLGIISDL